MKFENKFHQIGFISTKIAKFVAKSLTPTNNISRNIIQLIIVFLKNKQQ